MKRIIVSMNITLDGFMSGCGGELDWHFKSWTEEMAQSLCEQLSRADTILFGADTYSAMAGYWHTASTDLSLHRGDIAFAEMMNSYTKMVFSKKLTTLFWNNSHLITGILSKEILKLKQQKGKDIIIYGSGKLVSSLMRLGLIDEYILWLHPIVLSGGKPLFKKLRGNLPMRLIKIKQFNSGVVTLHYEPEKAARF